MTASKLCPSCGETKASSEFGRNRSRGDGLSFYCLECNRARSNEHYRKRREAQGKSVRDLSWVPDGFRWCPSCEKAVAHEDFDRSSFTASGLSSWCKQCKSAASRDAYFYRKYKLTRRALMSLRDEQDDLCAICGEPQPEHLDHDHETGGIRQLLCQRCNHGLGLFRDDPKLLHAAAYYVAFHTARQEVAAEIAAMTEAPQSAT